MMRRRWWATIPVGLAALAMAVPPDAAAPQAASQPVTAGDWFGPSAASKTDADTFARLYPRLAAVDRAVRAALPRTVFNAMLTPNQPKGLKVSPLHMTYQPFTDASLRTYTQSKPHDPWRLVPDERRARMAAIDARREGAAAVCFDIEALPLDARVASDADIDRSVQTIAQLTGWARAQDPGVRLFMYSFTPMTEPALGVERHHAATTLPSGANYPWWQANTPKIEARYQAWETANARLRASPTRSVGLAELFDGVCPSLYIHDWPEDPDPVLTARTMVWQHVDEARLYGKPIYPFVWPRLAEKRGPIPLRVWAAMIREIMIHADGAILWDDQNGTWDLPTAVRVRATSILADHRGEMTDRELFDALRVEFGANADLNSLLADEATTKQSP